MPILDSEISKILLGGVEKLYCSNQFCFGGFLFNTKELNHI